MSRPLPRYAAFPLILSLAACATTPGNGPAATGETITVSVGPCFGFCPVFEASLMPDGAVHFVGRRHTAVLGEKSRSAGVGAYRALARDLAPFRPADGTEARVECIAAVSDTSDYTVTWTATAGRKTTATVQSGCPGGPGQALVKLLREVETRLGIADWAKQETRPGMPRG